MKKEILIRNYEEIVEGFYREVQHILYCLAPLKTQVRMLHSAHYRATYYLKLHNQLLEQHFQEKLQG